MSLDRSDPNIDSLNAILPWGYSIFTNGPRSDFNMKDAMFVKDAIIEMIKCAPLEYSNIRYFGNQTTRYHTICYERPQFVKITHIKEIGYIHTDNEYKEFLSRNGGHAVFNIRYKDKNYIIGFITFTYEEKK